MRRYLDFRTDDWAEKTDSRMQSLRWAACVEGLGTEPPRAGVIDEYPEDMLIELLAEGWVTYPENMPEEESLAVSARRAMMSTLADDADALATEEHTLVERMLVSGGRVALDSVAEIEAAYTLRMRLWCDIGIENEEPVARLDNQLMEALPDIFMRPQHQEIRGRIFAFDGMLHAVLYIQGYLGDHMPVKDFVETVLRRPYDDETQRIASNYVEATFDIYTMADRNWLVHEALADPEQLSEVIPVRGGDMPEMTSEQVASAMNGLLPEEVVPNEKLQRALLGALRPEYETYDAATDLRYLAKQDAPMSALQEILSSMLVVLPTPHMEGVLTEMAGITPRWLHLGSAYPPRTEDGMLGRLH